MTAAGFDSQVAYAVETVSGTYTAPTFALEHVKSSLGYQRDPIISKGVKAGRRRAYRWRPGVGKVTGTTTHELSSANLGKLLKQLMGAVSTSGAGPYVHTFTDGPLVETQTMTVQVGKPDGTGTINPHNYLGCQLLSSTWTCKAANEFVIADWDWYGQHLQNTSDGDSVSALVAATYPAAFAPFSFLEATLTMNAADYEFDDVTLKFNNALKVDRYAGRATNARRPRVAKENGLKSTTLTLNSEHYSNAVLLRALAGTEVTATLLFSNSASDKLQISGTVRTLVKDPSVDGPDILKEGIELEFTSPTNDAAACTVTLTNSEATP